MTDLPTPARPPSPLSVIIATDCGSTTTKAILIEKIGGEYRQTFRGEAPTTVEAPFEDVTRGVLNACAEIEELSGRTILDGDRILTPSRIEADGRRVGVDLYVSTSSAGGGLQMVVSGVVRNMSGESAQRCALGAGAIVIDVLASNDGRLAHEKIERIRALRPDMILMAGGTDGGTVKHVVEMAQYISAAEPRPRFGTGFTLPVVYAGNKEVQPQVREILGSKTALVLAPNVRPSLEVEHLAPARDKIHELFLEHVMAQAPGYRKLIDMAGAPIMPTPGAVGLIMETIAKRQEINLLGVDIGGATTDVFSVFDGTFNRTVSANLGMSYSISNVLVETGLPNILRWVPFELDEQTLRNRIKNKMIRPTTIPQTLDELMIEHAIAREALRLALNHHKSLATGLKGVRQQRTISDIFEQGQTGRTLIDMRRLDLIVGSGGILSHAPRRAQSMLMMVDAYEPLGFTMLSVDSIFMMPHLGVLSTISEQAATDVFLRDCLIYLGTCVAPIGEGKPGEVCADYDLTFTDGRPPLSGSLAFGDLTMMPLDHAHPATLTLRPAKSVDAGAGRGASVIREVRGGVVGLVLDGRGRPLRLPLDRAKRQSQLVRWYDALKLYPKSWLSTVAGRPAEKAVGSGSLA